MGATHHFSGKGDMGQDALKKLGEEVKCFDCRCSWMNLRLAKDHIFEPLRHWPAEIGIVESVAGHIFFLASPGIRVNVRSPYVDVL